MDSGKLLLFEAVVPLILETTEQNKKIQANETLIARFGKSLHLDEASLEQLFINTEKHAQVLTESTNLKIKLIQITKQMQIQTRQIRIQ